MSGSVGSYGANPVLAFRQASKAAQEARDLARIAKEPDLSRTMAQFKQAVDKAGDIQAALRDPRVLAVLGTALGLPEAAEQAGLARRVLLADPADTSSLPNKLSDKRWLAMAQTLNLAKNGIDSLRDPKLQATLLEGLKTARRREELEAQTPGLGDALLFQQKAASVTTGLEVLGNPILRRVVTGALGIPQEIAVQSVEAQVRALANRYDVAKLKNPREVQKMAERYLTSISLSTAAGGGNTGLARYGFNV
jgi:hypothetical protein